MGESLRGRFDGACQSGLLASYHRFALKAKSGARLLGQASALAFNWSNSAGVIDPLSSSAFAEVI